MVNNLALAVIICVLSMNASVFAQEIFVSGSASDNTDRYRDIKGSPYLLKEFEEGTIKDINGESLKRIMLNYNGYTGDIEVNKDDKLVVLDSKYIDSVWIRMDGAMVVLVPQARYASKNKFRIYHSIGDRYQLFQEFSTKISEKVFNDYGQVRTMKRFISQDRYFITVDGDVTSLKLKKNDFLKVVDNPIAEEYIKHNKMKMKSLSEFIEVLEAVESGSH